MSILRTITKVRPNTSVSFKNLAKTAYIKSTYVDTNKLEYYNKTLSEDGLTLTIERIFVNQAALDEFEADNELALISNRNENISRGITRTKEITTLE